MSWKQDTVSLFMLGISTGLLASALSRPALLPFVLSFVIASQVTGKKIA